MNQQSDSRNKNRSFARTMTQARTHMNPLQRAWSVLIHQRVLDIIATSIGATIGRPLALLCGATGSIVVIIIMYSTAKTIGYPLSGSEGMAGFILGWTLGIIIEFIQAMITGGKRSR